MALPAYSYIDGVEIDDLWMRLKRDGVPTERLNKATAEVSGKVSLGLGKLINWLANTPTARRKACPRPGSAPSRLRFMTRRRRKIGR
jgi:hypothetical protein